jgi:hypothetical protein
MTKMDGGMDGVDEEWKITYLDHKSTHVPSYTIHELELGK